MNVPLWEGFPLTKISIAPVAFDLEEDYIVFEKAQKLKKLYIGPSEYENYDEDTKQFLYEFLCEQNAFPYFVLYEPYGDVTEEIEKLYISESIPYSLRYEGSSFKRFPVLTITINGPSALKLVLEESFWIAASNQFYSISFSNNTSYKPILKKGLFGKMKQYLVPCFTMKHPATVIKIWHDGQGFNLYTNDSKYSSVEQLISYLPNGTILE